MKKYILIQNDGEIETNSFELIGASTKRNESGKVGFFGSGLKYSIAYMMRSNIDFRVFSGINELIFTTKEETLRGQSFARICINGTPTSYTTTMGPTWKEDWFVLREIYCNAIDESSCQLVKGTENINTSEGKTRIYIELTDSLKSVVDNWDSYFSIDKEPLFVKDNVYTSFLGLQDIGGKRDQSVSVFRKTDGVLFRRGIRVYSDKEYAYDYNLEFVDINEDRTSKNASAMGYVFSNLMAQFPDENYVVNVLRTGVEDKPCREYKDIKYNSVEKGFSQQWVDFSRRYLLVSEDSSGKFKDDIIKSKLEVLYLPTYFAKKLKKAYPEVAILGIGRALGDVGMTDIDPTPKMNFLLKDTIHNLKEMKYEIPYDISIVMFDDNDTLGKADIEKKHIYLSDRLFDMGKREIALVLMEETEHIYSQQEDETRAFQNHIFSQWLKTMEESNGLFL